MKMLRSRKEKDFEFFVKTLPMLEPVEFAGLAKILSVKLVNNGVVLNLTKEEVEAMPEEARKKLVAEATYPMEEVLEKMMDRYLGLTKHGRKEINNILKDIKRSKKKEVNANGPTT